MERTAIGRSAMVGISILGALAVFALILAVPVSVDTDSGAVSLKAAQAGNGNGGGNGGGNGNGNGNGNAGGNGKGKGKRGDVATAPADTDETLLLVPLEEAITIAQFTTKISKRYPADKVISYDNAHQSISFFTELQAMTGKQITHLWIYGEEVQFKATFKIRAERWRVWSTQMLPEEMPGEWKVEVVDEEGSVLQVQKLNYAPNEAALAEN